MLKLLLQFCKCSPQLSKLVHLVEVTWIIPDKSTTALLFLALWRSKSQDQGSKIEFQKLNFHQLWMQQDFTRPKDAFSTLSDFYHLFRPPQWAVRWAPPPPPPPRKCSSSRTHTTAHLAHTRVWASHTLSHTRASRGESLRATQAGRQGRETHCGTCDGPKQPRAKSRPAHLYQLISRSRPRRLFRWRQHLGGGGWVILPIPT